MDIKQQCAEAYGRLKNLKLAGQELGVPWQTVYVYLKQLGVPVTGDKKRYGSATDRLAVLGESMFASWVPQATDNNAKQFQAKLDFDVLGYGVDVKTAKLKRASHRGKARRWAFCLVRQEMLADFVVLIALDTDKKPAHCFLIPGEVVRNYQTISIGESLNSKWMDYKIEPGELALFFRSLPSRASLKRIA